MKINQYSFHRRITMSDYLPYRDDYIVEKCKGKKVLHIGATDAPFTEEKFNKGTLLYSKIATVASEQLGVDLDRKSADFLNEKKLPNSRIEILNLDNIANFDFNPEVIIFGETLEHLMNLQTALYNIKKAMNENTELIISVPNATNFLSFIFAVLGLEMQHQDHKVAFTYKTLTQLLHFNDFEIEEVKFTWLIENMKILNWKGKLVYGICFPVSRIFPLFSGNIMVKALYKSGE